MRGYTILAWLTMDSHVWSLLLLSSLYLSMLPKIDRAWKPAPAKAKKTDFPNQLCLEVCVCNVLAASGKAFHRLLIRADVP